ncbi:MAG: hypothetical protein ACRDIA_08880, partial [Actinomycetota bacterium]
MASTIADRSRRIKTQAEKAEGDEKAKKAKPRRTGLGLLALSLIAVILIYAAVLFYLRPDSPGKELSLDQLVRIANCSAPAGATPDPNRE